MSVRDKTDGGRPGAGTHRVKRKIALGTVDNYRLNAADIAIFAAAFSLIADRSVSNTQLALKRILAESKEEDISKEEFLTQLGSASSESLAFSGLVVNLRKDLLKEARITEAQKYLQQNASETSEEEIVEGNEIPITVLADILGEGGKLEGLLNDDLIASNSGENRTDYSAESQQMQEAADDFLEILRELFSTELDVLAERQKQEGEGQQEQIPGEEEVVEVASSESSLSSYSALLSLLGLGGGGGGGGGFVDLVGGVVGGDLPIIPVDTGSSGVSSFSGFGIDGYVSGATVFWDIDGDFFQDANETVQTTTDDNGFYTLSGVGDSGQIVIKSDGIDTNTGGSVGMMAAAIDSDNTSNANITPLTLLKAQGVAESTILAALGDGVNVDIDTYDPMAVLDSTGADTDYESLEGDDLLAAQVAGKVLLQAQQLFGVINSISAIAEGAGVDENEAVINTLAALSENVSSGTLDLSNILGSNLTDADGNADAASEAALTGLLSTALNKNTLTQSFADDAAILSEASQSMIKVNAVLGESLLAPESALGSDARAASLITQNDLKSSFKSIGALDPEVAAAQITSKLSSFKNVDEIKTNFRDVYRETIEARAESQGGIVAGVDDVTILAGTNRLIDVNSQILTNDRDLSGLGLRLIAVEPAGLVYTSPLNATASIVTNPEVPATEDSASIPANDVNVYTLTIPDSISLDGYVKVKIGPFTVIERIDAGEDQSAVAAKIVSSIAGMMSQEDPLLNVSNDGPNIIVQRTDGAALGGVSIQTADNNAAIDVRLVKDEAGDVTHLSIDSEVVGNKNLKYIVANENGQSHGLIRLSVEPQFRTLEVNPGRVSQIIEDGELLISDQFVFTGTATTGVHEILFVKLEAASGGAEGFQLSLPGSTINLPVGRFVELSASDLATAKIIQPENYHGDFQLAFRMLSSDTAILDAAQFSSQSDITNSSITVIPDVELAADQAELKLILGGTTSDIADAIIPVVEGEPTAAQTAAIKLIGGDPAESHAVQFNGLPEGISLFVDGVDRTGDINFGSVEIEVGSLDTEIPIEFRASGALIDSSFGLFDGVTAFVIGREGATTGLGAENIFQFDIGGAYGLNVSAQSLTLGTEDVAVSLNEVIDITSIDTGAGVEVRITIQDPTAGDGQVPIIAQEVALADGSVELQPLAESETVSIDTSVDGEVTYTLSSSTPLQVFDNKKIYYPVDHFNESFNLNVQVNAVVDGDVIASVEKGPLTLDFAPEADPVTFEDPAVSVTAKEDQSLILRPLFLNGDNARANSADPDEEIIYVVSNLPQGTRLIDGQHLIDSENEGALIQDAALLKGLISQAQSIGRIVDDTIELSVNEAENAHIVTVADKSISGSITVSAYSRESNTTERTEAVGGHQVNISITANADAPYLSMDEKVRGLVNENLSDELLSKSYIKIPLSAALLDTDGSETLWLKIQPYLNDDTSTADVDESLSAYNISAFDINYSELGVSERDYFVAADGGYILIKSSDVSTLSLSRETNTDGFRGRFDVEAIAVEDNSGDASTVNTIINGDNPDLFEATSGSIAVEFLKPATPPVISVTDNTGNEDQFSYGKDVTDEGDRFWAEFKLDISQQSSDVVTVLVTGAPSSSAGQTKFYNSLGEQIGAPAEVSGVWVFNADDFNGSDGASDTIKMVLPAGYSYNEAAEKMNFTAYAVDELGLTSAKSNIEAVSVQHIDGDVPANAVDPLVVDVSGDGFSFANENPGVSFDINANGNADQIGWLSGADDAFIALIAEDEDGKPDISVSLDGDNLITEYLVNGKTTDALTDLYTIEAAGLNADGMLTQSELETYVSDKKAYLWFDDNRDGEAAYTELAKLNDFEINLNQFDDTTIIQNGTLIAAQQTETGGLSGSFERLDASGNVTGLQENQNNLSQALAADVFFPVAAPENQTTNATISTLSLNDATVYYEDNDNGLSILSSLTTGDWQTAFGTSAWEAIQAGTQVLLTVRTKNAGTTFNLSEGARLEDEPRDTWLTLWDPINGKERLDLFAKDNFSGQLALEVRATVVYTTGTGVSAEINQSTVQRDVTIDVAPVSDRPELLVPQGITDENGQDIAEQEEAHYVTLSGVELAASDSSEDITLVIEPVAGNPSDLISILRSPLDGGDEVVIQPDIDGKFTITGPILSGELKATIPAYASGTYNFTLTATSQDGDAAAKTVSGIPLSFSISPEAQAPSVTTEIEANILLNGVSEASPIVPVKLEAQLSDVDGSETLASMRVVVKGSAGAELNEAPFLTIESGNAESNVTYEFSYIPPDNTVDPPSDAFYQLDLPAAVLSDDGDGAYSVDGFITAPTYFDGEIEVKTFATSVENADNTENATGSSDAQFYTVNPIGDGFAEDGFITKGVAVLAGNPIKLSDIITELNVLDSDETITLKISGLPDAATLVGPLGEIGSLDGGFEITGLSSNRAQNQLELSDYVITTSDQQGNFSFEVSASTQDGLAISTENIRTVNIASTALLSPVLVKSDGSSLDEFVSFSAQEGGSGTLDLGVLLGNSLNPQSVTLQIAGIPDGFTVRSVSGETASFENGTFSINASKLGKGLLIEPSEDATGDQLNIVGVQTLEIQARTTYQTQTDAGDVLKLSDQDQTTDGAQKLFAAMNILPVTDGVAFETGLQFDEDEAFTLDELVSQVDPSETILSVSVGPNENLLVSYPGTVGFSPVSGQIEIPVSTIRSEDGEIDFSLVEFRPLDHFSGPINLPIAITSVATVDGVTGGTLEQENIASLIFDAVADNPVSGTNGDSNIELAETVFFEIFDEHDVVLSEPIINDGNTDLTADLKTKISIDPFSSPDRDETVFVKLEGSSVVSGSKVIVGSGVTAAIYEAAEVTDAPGEYVITIPGDGPDFSGVSLAEFLIPKENSGYGSKSLKISAVTNDGELINSSTNVTKTIEIFSTIPPIPGVGPDISIGIDDIFAELVSLENLISIPGHNESHVLELFDLHQGVKVLVGGEYVTPQSLHTNPSDGALNVTRISYDDFSSAFLELPQSVKDGTESLFFKARVGTTDGVIAGSDESRLVYSQLVDFDLKLNTQRTDNLPTNDVAEVFTEKASLGAGDDILFVRSAGNGALDGGQGADTINFSQLSQGNDVILDLNMGTVAISDSNNPENNSIEGVRQIGGFERFVGSDGNDTIIGSGSDTADLILQGGKGDDYLAGGAGNDLLVGGAGNDVLDGGDGSNTFVIVANEDGDTIENFNTGDKIIFANFGISAPENGAVPSEVQISRLIPDDASSDWVISVTKTSSSNTLSSFVVLSGSNELYAESSDLYSDLSSFIDFRDDLQLTGVNPLAGDVQLPIPALDIINDLDERDNFFGSDFTLDEISGALGVIADARFEQAFLIDDTLNDLETARIEGFSQALDDGSYRGISGSSGDDTIIASDSDSVLFGGDGGFDRLVGGSGNDVLLATAMGNHDTLGEDDMMDSLVGSAGSDTFMLINPSEINDTLNQIYKVKIEDFNRNEGDRVLLAGYGEDEEINLSEVDTETNIQQASIGSDMNNSMTIYFDLSFAREFDANFALRMADFDKIDL